MRNRLILAGPGLIFIAAILWGLDGIVRRSLFSLPPIIIVFYEHLIGLILIAPFFLLAKRRESLTRSEWGSIFFVSLLSGVLGTLWFTTALAKTGFIPFSVVFLLQKLQPLFAIAAGAVVLKERLPRRYLVWAAVALVAAYFVTFPNGSVNFAAGDGTLVAALFALGAAAAWGTSTAFSRYSLLNHSHTFITGLRFLITTVLAIGFVWLLGAQDQLLAPTSGQIGKVVIIALSTGMIALWIYYRGLKTTQTKVSTIVELAFPLTAVVIDIFLYDTVLLPTQYLAAAVLLFAIAKVSTLNNTNAVQAQGN